MILHPTPSELVSGWPGSDGIIVRLVRPGDLSAVAALADMAGGSLEDQMRTGITDSATAGALMQALRVNSKSPLLQQVAQVLNGAGTRPLLGMSMVLVAERSGKVVGALYSLPPLGYITQLINAGVPARAGMAVSTAVVKIRALAVDPQARGCGIATRLLQTAVQVYERIGIYLVYGTFDIGSGLESFYQARGFQILQSGHGVDMTAIIGYPATLEAGPGEQMFARWR